MQLNIKKRYIIISAFILILLAILFDIWYQHNQPASSFDSPSTKVVVTHPIKRSIQNRLDVPGHLVSRNKTWVTSHTNGFIAAILFQEGDHVNKNQPLVLLDPTKIKAKLLGDQAQLQQMQSQYQIKKHLQQKGFVSKFKLEQKHSQMTQARSNLEQDEATLKESIVRAPFSGYLGAKQIHIGDRIDSSTHLVQLVDRQHLLVKYHVPAKHVDQLHIGQTVAIHGTSHHFKGQISFIAPNIDTDTGTVEVHAQVNNHHNRLWPGRFVTVEQPLSKPKPTLLVPEQTVLSGIDSHYVFVTKDGKANKQKVQLGRDYNGCVVIKKGLDTSDSLILAGQHQVHDGQTIQVTKHKQAQSCKS